MPCRLRLWRWIPRRAECGTPCQTCRHRCQYDAIERSGAIRYDDCFQCLDCVGIHADEKRCAPVLLLFTVTPGCPAGCPSRSAEGDGL